MSMRQMKIVRRVLPLSAAAFLMAVPVAAQEGEPIGDPIGEQCICAGQLRAGEIHAGPWRAFTVAQRARLGVMLGEPVEAGGRHGVELEAVPEGSPAHRAGLRQGDVLVALEGRELGPNPAATLLELLGDAEPGDTLRVTFSRAGQERTARVATERASAPGILDREGLLRLRALAPSFGPERPDERAGLQRSRVLRPSESAPRVLHRRLLRDRIQLAAVNPELGEYFGTEDGVLVTQIDPDSPLGLRSGDVILTIGGRDVRDPAHVRAILASYRPGEEIAFGIMREKRSLEVTGIRRSARAPATPPAAPPAGLRRD